MSAFFAGIKLAVCAVGARCRATTALAFFANVHMIVAACNKAARDVVRIGIVACRPCTVGILAESSVRQPRHWPSAILVVVKVCAACSWVVSAIRAHDFASVCAVPFADLARSTAFKPLKILQFVAVGLCLATAVRAAHPFAFKEHPVGAAGTITFVVDTFSRTFFASVELAVCAVITRCRATTALAFFANVHMIVAACNKAARDVVRIGIVASRPCTVDVLARCALRHPRHWPSAVPVAVKVCAANRRIVSLINAHDFAVVVSVYVTRCARSAVWPIQRREFGEAAAVVRCFTAAVRAAHPFAFKEHPVGAAETITFVVK